MARADKSLGRGPQFAAGETRAPTKTSRSLLPTVRTAVPSWQRLEVTQRVGTEQTNFRTKCERAGHILLSDGVAYN